MAKLTHAEADRQVEQAMVSPTGISIGKFQEYMGQRNRVEMPEVEVPQLPTPETRQIPATTMGE